MLEIIGSKIRLTRGDTANIALNITKAGEPYELASGDKITFTMRKNEYSDIVVQKVYTKDNFSGEIQIEQADTSSLEFGTYVYDIQFDFSTGETDTRIVDVFEVTSEVTY